MIKDALARQPQLKIVASPWTGARWMKDNNDWYGKGQGRLSTPGAFTTPSPATW